MKGASRVFLIIGLVCSIVLCLLSLRGIGIWYLIYGIYGIVTSIGGLISVNGKSKGAVVFWGILYIPVVLLASIFMWCIKPEDLN